MVCNHPIGGLQAVVWKRHAQVVNMSSDKLLLATEAASISNVPTTDSPGLLARHVQERHPTHAVVCKRHTQTVAAIGYGCAPNRTAPSDGGRPLTQLLLILRVVGHAQGCRAV
jgi:hypothetical protein